MIYLVAVNEQTLKVFESSIFAESSSRMRRNEGDNDSKVTPSEKKLTILMVTMLQLSLAINIKQSILHISKTNRAFQFGCLTIAVDR